MSLANAKTLALKMRIADWHVAHIHEIDDLTSVTFTYSFDCSHPTEFIGHMLLPNTQVRMLHLVPGDTMTILIQKTLSQHHQKQRIKKS